MHWTAVYVTLRVCTSDFNVMILQRYRNMNVIASYLYDNSSYVEAVIVNFSNC